MLLLISKFSKLLESSCGVFNHLSCSFFIISRAYAREIIKNEHERWLNTPQDDSKSFENLDINSNNGTESKMVSTIIPELRTASELSIYLLAKHNYDMAAKPPIDVDKVAQLLNINVDESRLSSDSNKDVIGKITLDKGMPATVWMNPVENSYPPRRRFTLAHEIGHFCMHRSTN